MSGSGTKTESKIPHPSSSSALQKPLISIHDDAPQTSSSSTASASTSQYKLRKTEKVDDSEITTHEELHPTTRSKVGDNLQCTTLSTKLLISGTRNFHDNRLIIINPMIFRVGRTTAEKILRQANRILFQKHQLLD